MSILGAVVAQTAKACKFVDWRIRVQDPWGRTLNLTPTTYYKATA